MTPLKLSICISTYNRADFIGGTLESICHQLTDECEIVVLDGASPDSTARVVGEYTARCSRIRYAKQEVNNGIDRDFDRAVELARGEFCWLMSDDDSFKPGAISKVLGVIGGDVSLVLVNWEVTDVGCSEILRRRSFQIATDRRYGPAEMERLFVDVEKQINYIGCVVIRRSIWLERDKESYYGTLFSFIGVIFQKPLPGHSLIIAEPLIRARIGNSSTFSTRMFEVFTVNLPSVFRRLPISNATKRRVCDRDPWSLKSLLYWRAAGGYSFLEYRRLIRPRLRSPGQKFVPVAVALLPGVMVNSLLTAYYKVARSPLYISLLRQSRFHIRNRKLRMKLSEE